MDDLSHYHYTLPQELIALHPTKPRDACRLMVLDRTAPGLAHARFHDLPELLREGDLLVVNDSRVIPGRLRGIRLSTGAQLECLLVEEMGPEVWTCLVKPASRARKGDAIAFGEAEAMVEDVRERGLRVVRFLPPWTAGRLLREQGEMPIPPYIDRPSEMQDREDYQTVYAAPSGSIAAPTAGLHFTESLIERLRRRGIRIAQCTLHVGLGTFTPIRCHRLSEHRMERERFEVPLIAAESINQAKEQGQRVIAVGTTVVRTLESCVNEKGQCQNATGTTDLFIKPGHVFRIVDGLITNFHLPESSLLVLVSAFAGREKILHAYEEAKRLAYRFTSYGDAMLIL